MMNLNRFFQKRTVFLLVAFILAALVPLIFKTNQYAMVLVTTVLLYATLASAWNIIGGMGGQLDLAAGAYVGLGAFTTGTLLMRWDITPWIGMLASGAVAAAFAVLIGYPLFRFKVKELWYALTSSALVEVLRVLFLMWDEVGGPTEKYLPVDTWSWYHLRFNTYMPYFYIILGLLVITLFINYRIRNTKLGYSLLALGEDEDAAEVLGVAAQTNKLKALVIYAFIVGMVGGLYACIYGFLHPTFFSTEMSTEVAILGIVGGMGITFGPVLAAIFLVSFREYLRATLGGSLEGLYLVAYALILILVVLFQPRGIAPMLQNIFERIKSYFGGRKNAASADVKSN
jgi:branched-chain amino acid transport system permease protein